MIMQAVGTTNRHIGSPLDFDTHITICPPRFSDPATSLTNTIEKSRLIQNVVGNNFTNDKENSGAHIPNLKMRYVLLAMECDQ